MKRLFLLVFAAMMLMPLHADAYHDALATYLQSSDVTSTQQLEEKLRPLIEQAIPDNPNEANILLKRYVNTQLMSDIVDIFEPAFRRHISVEELQELARIYSNPRYAEIQNKMVTAFNNLQSSREFENLQASMGTAMQAIANGKKPQPYVMNMYVPEEYKEKFNHYYRASKMEELINQSFAGVADIINTQLRNNGVSNAEQITTQLMEYLKGSMPSIMMQLVYRSLTESDLQMLIDASCSPAYQHTVDAVSEIVADPLGLSAQLLTKMGAWVDTNARRYSKSFQPIIQTLNEAANPYLGEIYMAVDQQPEYPDGVKELFHYIAANIQMTPENAERGFRGKTITRFVVNKNGALSDFEIVRSCGDTILDAEAVRVLATMKAWKPAMLKNEIVRAYYTLPVSYNIPPTPRDSLPAAPAAEQPDAEDEQLFVLADQMPEFPGGTQALFAFLSENVKYPQIAYENRIQGKVIVQFVVNKDGSITDVEVVKSGGDPSLDREAVRVIKSMPKWRPGKQQGKLVRVRYSVPVNFHLTANNADTKKDNKKDNKKQK